MSLVAHMVCPSCACRHGQEHASVCPEVYEGEDRAAYRKGWIEGRAYMVAAYEREFEKERKRADEAEARVLAKLPELLARVRVEGRA